ncbi:DeoR/GlpR family transcriptional regulator [Alteromonas aestuariivivens]|uniref:DeoR/GlpR family transcriptional regulator n=1 Tax=Alteromonas aestuariivivens TaxID=1938339 RepID=A0A3D8ME46_9ALTE|nr:DeoR/GlpR family transcriptional regulator [Alteromonas aestuariivivens]RDV29023.1 DeoR/GlpR family transcriptional regulator [Alteromonas aestuariivivens]
MNQAQRHEKIVDLIKQQGFMSIDELVERCEVTPQTIRRDLNQLAEGGVVCRYHGGAGINKSWENTPYQERKSYNRQVKERIAIAVANMIPDGASLFINIGTTTEMIATKLLNHKNLHVVTNNLHVASILSAKEDFTVIIAAGEVRYRDGGIIGEATCDFISQFRMDFGIIGISGISSDGALLDFDFREVKVSQAILKHTRKAILAADYSKFERHAMVEQGHLSQVDYLVCDKTPPAPISKIIKENNITFVKA